MRNFGEIDAVDLVLDSLYLLQKAYRVDIHELLYNASKKSKKIASLLTFKQTEIGPWSEKVSDTINMLIDVGSIEKEEGMLKLSEWGLERARESWLYTDDKEKTVLIKEAEKIRKKAGL
jgi:uncharacterized protein YwgA